VLTACFLRLSLCRFATSSPRLSSPAIQPDDAPLELLGRQVVWDAVNQVGIIEAREGNPRH